MLNKGQILTVGFVIRIALGLLLVLGLFYASNSFSERVKKRLMRDILTSSAQTMSSQVIDGVKYLDEKTTVNKKFRIPEVSGFEGGYRVKIVNSSGVLFAEARSNKWNDVYSRQPIYLNASKVYYQGVAHPPITCIQLNKTSGYNLILGC